MTKTDEHPFFAFQSHPYAYSYYTSRIDGQSEMQQILQASALAWSGSVSEIIMRMDDETLFFRTLRRKKTLKKEFAHRNSNKNTNEYSILGAVRFFRNNSNGKLEEISKNVYEIENRDYQIESLFNSHVTSFSMAFTLFQHDMTLFAMSRVFADINAFYVIFGVRFGPIAEENAQNDDEKIRFLKEFVLEPSRFYENLQFEKVTEVINRVYSKVDILTQQYNEFKEKFDAENAFESTKVSNSELMIGHLSNKNDLDVGLEINLQKSLSISTDSVELSQIQVSSAKDTMNLLEDEENPISKTDFISFQERRKFFDQKIKIDDKMTENLDKESLNTSEASQINKNDPKDVLKQENELQDITKCTDLGKNKNIEASTDVLNENSKNDNFNEHNSPYDNNSLAENRQERNFDSRKSENDIDLDHEADIKTGNLQEIAIDVEKIEEKTNVDPFFDRIIKKIAELKQKNGRPNTNSKKETTQKSQHNNTQQPKPLKPSGSIAKYGKITDGILYYKEIFLDSEFTIQNLTNNSIFMAACIESMNHFNLDLFEIQGSYDFLIRRYDDMFYFFGQDQIEKADLDFVYPFVRFRRDVQKIVDVLSHRTAG